MIDKRLKYKDKKLTKGQQKKAKAINSAGIKSSTNEQETVTVPKKWLSSPDHVIAELAYITPREQKILLDADLYGALNGQANRSPGGIMSLQGAGDGGGSEDKGNNDHGSPNPGPDSYSVQDDLTDYATNVGKTANTTGGGFVGDDKTPSLPPGVIPNTFVPKAPPKKKGFWDYSKQALGILSFLNPGTTIAKVGNMVTAYDKISKVSSLAKDLGITNTDVVGSLTNNLSSNFTGFDTTTKGPKDPTKGQVEMVTVTVHKNALMAEYLLLLQKMEQGSITKRRTRKIQ